MKIIRPIYIVALLCLCEASGLAQGIVWHWVPSPQPDNSVFPGPYGAPIDIGYSFSIDMTGNGKVNFVIQAIPDAASELQVLPEGSNAVLSQVGNAINLSTGDQVSALTPIGAQWVEANTSPPFPTGPDLLYGNSDFGYAGQFVDQRGYVGVEFYEADGIHYGALDIWGISDSPIEGILYGYGYNPVPNQPFNLSDIPAMPVPEPSTWDLFGLGIAALFYRKNGWL